ncbi:MAG TPA: ferric reductase-like transmembrane domain-containing protein [Acidimicrobiia bacterium]|nr:ferric reductase-like transmembrane domain-containing protein [Acidimicrobiia bacterium]
MSGQFPWYVARSAGLVAWALLAASVLWGLALSTKILSPRVRPNWILDLHRWLGGLALAFTAVHVGSLLLDTYVHFGLVSLLVPFASTWHPSAVAWGVVSLYLLGAVEVTSLLKARLPRSLWRRTHFLSFGLFVTSTVHGLSAGTDTGATLLRLAALLTAALFAGLTAARILEAVSPVAPAPRTLPRRPGQPLDA